MTRIVILGAGLGGTATAYDLKAALGDKADILVVGDGPYFNFTPSNPWVAVGWREPEQIRVEVASALGKHGIRYSAIPAETILPAENQIRLVDEETIGYDYLVIATGPRLAFDEVPGLGPEEGFTQSVCTGPHAQTAWLAYQKFLENPGPLVVGAVQGASCYGPAYEFAMIVDADLRRRKLRDRVPMTFVTAEPYIGHMGLGGVGDSKGLLESELRQRDIRWIANAKVTSAEPLHIMVDEVDADGHLVRSHDLPYAFAMLIPAFTGVTAVRRVPG
ncbi:MAG: NAD(P)/FAD-dependent oxidoreductase, partial [Rhodanobacteraceae bacterium]